jgi:hypothetical protein
MRFAVRLELYTSSPPSGRCVVVIKGLSLVSKADSQWCIESGQRLFNGQHPLEKPLVVPVVDPEHLPGFLSTCAENGIAVQVDYG